MNWLIDDYIDDIRWAMERWIDTHSLEWHKQFQADSVIEDYYLSWSWEHDDDEEPPELTDEELDAMLEEDYRGFCEAFGVDELMEEMLDVQADFNTAEDSAWDILVVFLRAIHLQHCHGGIPDHCSKLTYDLVDSISQNGLEQTFGEAEVERFIREW